MQVTVNQVEHARELYLRGEKSNTRQIARLYFDSKIGGGPKEKRGWKIA